MCTYIVKLLSLNARARHIHSLRSFIITGYLCARATKGGCGLSYIRKDFRDVSMKRLVDKHTLNNFLRHVDAHNKVSEFFSSLPFHALVI